MLNEPQPGDPSYSKWKQEKDSLYEALARKSKMVHTKLNAIEGVSCQVPPVPLSLPLALPPSLPHARTHALARSITHSLSVRWCVRPCDASIPTCTSTLTLSQYCCGATRH